MSLDAIPRERLTSLLRTMPKAELHIHIEGTLEPELIFALAARNGVVLPYVDVDALRAAHAFTDLRSFLDIYYAGASVLLKEEDFFDMAMAYFRRAAADHVVRAELFFDPQTHTDRGVPIKAVINGLSRACETAQRDLGVSGALILCFLRHLSEKAAFATLEQALPYRAHFIGIGLDSSELGHPPEKFARVFACPLSNVKLRVYPTMAQHQLPALLEAGLCATINSDDPAYFGGYLNQNFVETFAALPQLGAKQAWQLAANSFEASFASASDKQAWMVSLDATFAAP